MADNVTCGAGKEGKHGVMLQSLSLMRVTGTRAPAGRARREKVV